MTTEIARHQDGAQLMEQVLVGGDLSKLTPSQRMDYYSRVCESMALNPLSKPFDYITLNGKLTLYAKKDATDQLRSKRDVSIVRLERERQDDVYTVTAYATLPNGRQDSSIGAVSIGGLKGDALANALMKAETKAKRRVTLSICGLGWLDETEIETVRDARSVTVNHETGEILDAEPAAPARPKAPAEPPAQDAKSQKRLQWENAYEALVDQCKQVGMVIPEEDCRSWDNAKLTERYHALDERFKKAKAVREDEQAAAGDLPR